MELGTAYPGGSTSAPREKSLGGPSWHTLLFITIVFFIIDHNILESLHVLDFASVAATEKADLVAAGNLPRRIAYVAFGLYGLALWLDVPLFRLSARRFLAVILLAYLGWAVLSLTWSVSPTLTVRRLSVLGLMSLGITGLLRKLSGEGIVRLVFFSTLSYLMVGVGAELALGVFTPWSAEYRFAGTLHPNVQGINCAALVFAALTMSASRKRFRLATLAVALLAFAFLLLTGSRTALGACITGICIGLALKSERRFAVLLASTICCAALVTVVLVVNGVVPSPLEVLVKERSEGVGVLTGRSDLWVILLGYARERPSVGYGYGAFLDPTRGLEIASRVGGWAFGGPHSIYFEGLLDLGGIGVLALVGVLLGSVLKSVGAYRRSLSPEYLFFAALLVFQIVDGLTEAEMLSPNPHLVPCLAVAFLAFRAP